ncbi:MAG: HD domain-containing protein [Holosporales bacterium]|jgi:putative nucleotidyltransferase with HDIG domain|nr:HD domain-containing protein [Holosporales bacterium]
MSESYLNTSLLDELLPENWRSNQKNFKTYTHSKTVAAAARIVAKKSQMEWGRAYTYGLMHDIGKFYVPNSRAYKHPRVGYEILKDTHRDIAEICVTHSFPNIKSFDHIINYCKNDKKEASKILSILETIHLNDYMELIQLCDKVSGLDSYTSIEAKLKWYTETNQINENDIVTVLYRKKLESIKSKFDSLAGTNVYKLLGIDV